jgi:hypothetical protein
MHQPIDRHHNDTFRHSRKGRLAAVFLGCIVSISALVNFISAFRNKQVLYGGRIAPTGWISYHAHPALFMWVLAVEACATMICIGVIYTVFFKDIDQA